MPPWSLVGLKVLIRVFPCTIDSEGLGLLTSIMYSYSLGNHISEFSHQCEVVHTTDHILREWPHVHPPRGATVVSWWFGESYDLISVYMWTPLNMSHDRRSLIISFLGYFFGTSVRSTWTCRLFTEDVQRPCGPGTHPGSSLLLRQSNRRLSCCMQICDTDSTFGVRYNRPRTVKLKLSQLGVEDSDS